jgi:ABC-type oligopeptide transport system substrate-binding subunit
MALILGTVLAHAQVKPDSLRMPTNQQGMVEVSEVVLVKGKKADDIFGNALQFIAENYDTPSAVTKLSDRSSGKILVSTFFIVDQNFHIRCTLEIDSKDGKYRYKFKDFTYQVVIEGLDGDLAPKEKIFDPIFPSNNYKNPETYTKLANGTLDKINSLIKNLKRTIDKNDSF